MPSNQVYTSIGPIRSHKMHLLFLIISYLFIKIDSNIKSKQDQQSKTRLNVTIKQSIQACQQANYKDTSTLKTATTEKPSHVTVQI